MFLDENEIALLKRYFLGEELTEREHESAVLIADCYDSHIGQTGLFADVWVDVPEEEREKEFARMCEEDVEDIRQYLSLYGALGKKIDGTITEEDYEDYAEQWLKSDQLHMPEEMWDQYGMSVFLGNDTITYEEALADCGGDREKLMRTSLILELHDKPPENPEPLPPSYLEDEDEIIDDDLY